MALKDRRIRRKIDKLFERKASGEWEQKAVAELGNETGTVKTGVPGMVYARPRNGHAIEVYNDVAPEDHGVKVWIGRRKETPTLWQVICQRDSYSVPQAPRLSYHGSQHMFRAPDEVPIDRKQITQLTLIVSDADDFILALYGGPVTSASGNAIVETQFVDVAPYIPASGAVYVSIEADSAGAITIHTGTGFASPSVATAALIPLPAAGKRRIGWILLFQGQEELLDEHVYVPMPLETNFNDTITSTNIDFPIGHIHGLARWNGTSGESTFELPDIWEYVDSVMLNGLEEDPAVYSLSADGTQIILDAALASDTLIMAHGVIVGV